MQQSMWRRVSVLLAAAVFLGACAGVSGPPPGMAPLRASFDKPVTDPEQRFVFKGYSIVPPGGVDDGWYFLPRSLAGGREGATVDQLFGKKPPAGVNEMDRNPVLVTVSSMDLGAAPASAAELAAYTEKDLRSEVARYPSLKLLDLWVLPEDTSIAACAGYAMTVEDAHPAYAPGGTFIILRRGVSCLHPKQKGRLVMVEMTEKYPAGEAPDVPDEEAAVFFQSLSFE